MNKGWIWLTILSLSISIAYAQSNSKTYLFIGSYTNGKPGRGIYVYAFDAKSGAVEAICAIDHITNPSYITLSPNGQYLYACTDTKMPDTGSVTAFKFNRKQGTLSYINRQDSGGDNPVYVSVHKGGKWLINANYTGGSVSAFALNDDGSIQPAAQSMAFVGKSKREDRQEKPHIHAAVFSPEGDYAFLPDLGSDKIWTFSFDASKSKPMTLKEEDLVTSVPGSGPRHFTFHPNRQYAYCIEELSGMVSTYTYSNGKLDPVQRIFANSYPHDSCWSADIHISPDGRFLYASNRGKDENTIAIFSIDQDNGMLKPVGHQSTYGDHPRNFTIDPSGKFLLVANMISGNIVVFKRDLKTGLLTRTKNEIQVPFPSCLQMRTYGG
jgi:6-phosphogluconolactonase (cycloisomerase 2 family)